MDRMFVSPQNSSIETLHPHVMILGVGASWGWLGLHEVMKVGPLEESQEPFLSWWERNETLSHLLSAMWGYTKKLLSTTWKSALSEPNLLAPCTWPTSLQNWREMSFCCFSPPGYGMLVQQPKLTNTDSIMQRVFLNNSSRKKSMCVYVCVCVL